MGSAWSVATARGAFARASVDVRVYFGSIASSRRAPTWLGFTRA
jgi:hypothetical protein